MVSTITDRVYGESSGVAVKAPCVAVATTPNPLSGLGAVGSYSPQPNDRILVMGQTDPTTNGIYNASTGVWARSGDFDGAYDCVQGTLIVVFFPNGNGTIYQLTTLNPIIGTTPLIFSAFVSPNTTYQQTPVEAALGIVPANTAFMEGNILRYGASPALADNSAAFMSALQVSGAGGSVAFHAPGSYPTTNPIVVPANASMFGAGKSSKIVPAYGVDGLQFAAGTDGLVPQSRFFRDFQVVGTLGGVDINTNPAHGLYIAASPVIHTLFQNISILNFQWGVYSQGLYDSTFLGCFIQNCWNGYYFNTQSINVSILDCFTQYVSAGTLITGPGYSMGISCQGAPEVEGLHIQGGSIYGFNYNINLGLIYECQINAVDISYATVCGIYFSSVIGPLIIRDCWIELAGSASGTYNNKMALGDGNLTAIFAAAITPSVYQKVSIVGCQFWSDDLIVTSVGLYIGNSNNGITVHENHFYNFDTGISGGNTLTNVGGTFNGGSIKSNTFNVNTLSMLIGSGCQSLELGPNYIENGALVEFSSGPPASMVYSQPNVPMKGEAVFAASVTATVTFTNPLPAGFNTYAVGLGGNSAGNCYVVPGSKTNLGFEVGCAVANSNSVDWQIST